MTRSPDSCSTCVFDSSHSISENGVGKTDVAMGTVPHCAAFYAVEGFITGNYARRYANRLLGSVVRGFYVPLGKNLM